MIAPMPAATLAAEPATAADADADARPRLTVALIAASIVATLACWHTTVSGVWRWLTIDGFVGNGEERMPAHDGRFHDILHGQVWRLVTPVLAHATFLHLALNLVWVFVLGRMIEALAGRRTLAALILVLAVGCDVAQYLWDGPFFGGLSGIVYGLLGYAWMRQRLDPDSGFAVPLGYVLMLAIWFVYSAMSEHSGTAAHALGLVIGVAWGAAASRRPVRA
jgi:GlpG protein